MDTRVRVSGRSGVQWNSAVIAFGLFAAVCAVPSRSVAQGDIIELDAVVASVDGNPITLSDLRRKLPGRSSLTLQQAAADPEARQLLDRLVMQQLLEQEAKQRQIAVSDKDVEEYIRAVAERNQLSEDDFERALQEQGKTLASYRDEVKQEILKTKIASNYIREGVTISDEEVDAYLRSRTDLNESGTRVTLRQLLVSSSGRDSTAMHLRLTEALKKMSDGESFEKVAERYSDAPDAAEGGLLGAVKEEDLSPDIQAAVKATGKGKISQPVESGMGLRVFKVEDRVSGKAEITSQMREEARKALRSQKVESRLSQYFESELMKKHAVEKKL